MSKKILFALLILTWVSPAVAEKYDIEVRGRSDAVTTGNEIVLGDIALITPRSVAFTDEVLELGRIKVARSPKPGTQSTVTASQVISKLRDVGTDLDRIGYAFPRVMKVTRAGRALRQDEIEPVVREFFDAQHGRDLNLKKIEVPKDISVVPGNISFEVLGASIIRDGKMQVRLLARDEEREEFEFRVEAIVDEWVDVPVAKRPLLRGSIIGDQDLMMARMNIAELPTDFIREEDELLGLEASSSVGYGQVFRKGTLEVPPVITSGSKVTMVYRSNSLRASATGVALNNAAPGDRVRVKNESSKKIVEGVATSNGFVEVRP